LGSAWLPSRQGPKQSSSGPDPRFFVPLAPSPRGKWAQSSSWPRTPLYRPLSEEDFENDSIEGVSPQPSPPAQQPFWSSEVGPRGGGHQERLCLFAPQIMYLAQSFISSKIWNSERGYFPGEVFYFTRCSVLFYLLKGGFIVWRFVYLGGLLPTTGGFLHQPSPYIRPHASLPAGRGGCWYHHCGGGRSLVAAYLLLGEAALP